MKIALFDFRGVVSDEIVMEYFDYKRKPLYFYHFDCEDDCYRKVSSVEFLETFDRMMSDKDLGEVYYSPHPFETEDEINYVKVENEIKKDRADKEFIEFATKSKHLSRCVKIVDIPVGKMIRIKEDEDWGMEIYEEFKEDEWIISI